MLGRDDNDADKPGPVQYCTVQYSTVQAWARSEGIMKNVYSGWWLLGWCAALHGALTPEEFLLQQTGDCCSAAVLQCDTCDGKQPAVSCRQKYSLEM